MARGESAALSVAESPSQLWVPRSRANSVADCGDGGRDSSPVRTSPPLRTMARPGHPRADSAFISLFINPAPGVAHTLINHPRYNYPRPRSEFHTESHRVTHAIVAYIYLYTLPPLHVLVHALPRNPHQLSPRPFLDHPAHTPHPALPRIHQPSQRVRHRRPSRRIQLHHLPMLPHHRPRAPALHHQLLFRRQPILFDTFQPCFFDRFLHPVQRGAVLCVCQPLFCNLRQTPFARFVQCRLVY